MTSVRNALNHGASSDPLRGSLRAGSHCFGKVMILPINNDHSIAIAIAIADACGLRRWLLRHADLMTKRPTLMANRFGIRLDLIAERHIGNAKAKQQSQ